MDVDKITEKIIGAAIKVHAALGPGLLEAIYEKCMAIELTKMDLRFQCQFPVHVVYDGIKLGHGYFIDLLVENAVVVEIKAVDRLAPVHTAQLISYLRLSHCTVGLLLNFNAYSMRAGLKRVVLGHRDVDPRFPR